MNKPRDQFNRIRLDADIVKRLPIDAQYDLNQTRESLRNILARTGIITPDPDDKPKPDEESDIECKS